MNKNASAFYGYVISAFVPPLSIAAGLILTEKWDFFYALGWAGILTLPSAFFSFMLGAPVFAVLDNYKCANWLTLPTAGFFAGSLVAVIITLPSLGALTVKGAIGYGLIGALTALVFWSIWRLGRN